MHTLSLGHGGQSAEGDHDGMPRGSLKPANSLHHAVGEGHLLAGVRHERRYLLHCEVQNKQGPTSNVPLANVERAKIIRGPGSI